MVKPLKFGIMVSQDAIETLKTDPDRFYVALDYELKRLREELVAACKTRAEEISG